MARPPKKSESIELRIPYEAKQAFMARCREEGISASEALRRFIDSQVAPAPPRPPMARRALQLAAGAAAMLAVGATALPSLAGQPQRAGFERLDLDHSGAVTLPELREAFLRLDRNHDGQLSFEELYGR